MYKKILVPLDGSKRAELILPHVEELALKYSSEVCLLQVVEPILDMDPAYKLVSEVGKFTSVIKSAQTYIDSIASRMREKGISVKGWALSGNVVDTICRVTEQEKANLIAIASHGRTGAARVFYGSVAVGILNRVDRPLLIIRSKENRD